MRIIKIVKDEYYHIYLRGNNRQNIFHDNKDRERFLFLILYLQSEYSFSGNTSHYTIPYTQSSAFGIGDKVLKEILKSRFIELVNFSLMPNHFHLSVYNKREGGIPRYMQKVLTAYTKYYNTKYKTTGHLFEGPYQYRHIKDDEQLTFVSAYIHRNAREIRKWYGKEHTYPWSSFQDYIGENRWGELLQNDIIMQKFENKKDYKKFVAKSGAKAYLGENMFI